MKKKFLHIILDEKFPDSAYELFEYAEPNQNDFILLGKKHPIKYLKKIKPKRINYSTILNPWFRKSLENYHAVLIHGMTNLHLELIARCSNKVNFVWIGMGYDYYDLIYENDEKLYGKDTLLLKKQLDTETKNKNKQKHVKLKFKIKNLIHKALYKKHKNKKEILNKINYFSPVLKIEFEIIKEKNSWFKPKYIFWNYANLSNIIAKKKGKIKNITTNILLGNSATLTNNHKEVIDLLSKVNLSKIDKIITPLNYGNKVYKNKIKEIGIKSLGEKFKPINEFISFESYVEIISSCQVVIMNHKRQQAGFNISAALLFGARVFLNKKNPFYSYYIDNGIILNSIDDLKENPTLIDTKLTDSEKEKNRDIIINLRSWDTAITKTINLIKTVCKIK